MSIKPEPGLVIRYDYLWKEERDTGQEDGSKDRPCAIIMKSEPDEDGSRKVLVCPITHSPPEKGETGVEIPPKVAQHLKLDNDRSWIKTHELNRFTWEEGRIPVGVSPAHKDQWTFGLLPAQLSMQVFNQVREKSRERGLDVIQRDDTASRDRGGRGR